MSSKYVPTWTTKDEILNPENTQPHVVLLGAGASLAALPNGDRTGITLPLMRELATSLSIVDLFPANLRKVAQEDFELAYSQLRKISPSTADLVDKDLAKYFSAIDIPASATIYDYILLSLRPKDTVCTFNWDPLLVQSCRRLRSLGVKSLPQLQFLHGNVAVGFCAADGSIGVGELPCAICGKPLTPSPLLFPVEKKGYKDGGFLEGQWLQTSKALSRAMIFTIFGYRAPDTDVEAKALLKQAWGM